MSRDKILERLSKLSTAVLSDSQRRMGRSPGSMHSTMKPVWQGAEFCGPAFTVRTYAGATHGCDLALERAAAGDVVVVAGGGFTEAVLWGEIYSAAARNKGLAGTVIDGAARDVRGIQDVGYPVFARAITPCGGTADETQSETQIVVSCAGVVVRPKDFVRGDEMGVVVVPAEDAPVVVAAAEATEVREARMLELMSSGATLKESARLCAEEGL